MYTVHSIPKSAAAMAEAVPCIPAPVSAMMRFAPMRLARSICPMQLLILCAPLWFRSSRFRKSRPPPRSFEMLRHSVRAEGRPT